jgi:hypothetical protein
MNLARHTRRLTPLVAAGALFVSALAAVAFAGGTDATHRHATAPTVTRSELALRNDLRRLWEDHIVWTRLAIISLTTGAPDTNATVARLLKNQADIGNALRPLYGNAAAARLTTELRKHILIAADVVAAAKAGDQAGLAEAQAHWRANADGIATLLNRANPHFGLRALKAEMRMHLDLTTSEAVARLQGRWSADVAAYDAIHRHILHLADYLAAGIVAQFPQRFR